MDTILPVVSPDVLSDPAIFKGIVKHKACLISFSHYARPKDDKEKQKVLDVYKALANNGVNVVLDSGAYEVYTSKGKLKISKEEYADFLSEYAVDDPSKGKTSLFANYINLDVIGKEEPSRDNLLYFIEKRDLRPMPVFHQQNVAGPEYWSALKFCMQHADEKGVVGLGGAVGKSVDILDMWYDKINIKTAGQPRNFHALGVAAFQLLHKYRSMFYYADAGTWTWGSAAYGMIRLFDPNNPDGPWTWNLQSKELDYIPDSRIKALLKKQCSELHMTKCDLLEKRYGGCA